MSLLQLFIDVLQTALVSKYTAKPMTRNTFKALTDAITPSITGSMSASGGDLKVEEYVISVLDHLNSVMIGNKDISIPLSNSTAEILMIAAKEIISRGDNHEPVDLAIMKEHGHFAALARSDRIRAIKLLFALDIDLKSLPVPFWNNSAFVLATIKALPLFVTFGYYSEWTAYGTIHKFVPGERVVEHLPHAWKSVAYPGISNGYHACRGYLHGEYGEK